MIEAWFTLMSEAMRGSSNAQNAIKMLTGNAVNADYLNRWFGQFMPGLVESNAQSQMFGEWLEEWWKLLGVVPRYRYLEQLERNEDLRRRLEACEKRSAQTLAGSTMNVSDFQEETQKAMGAWGAMMEGVLKTQAQMFQNFLASSKETGETTEETQETEKKPAGPQEQKPKDTKRTTEAEA